MLLVLVRDAARVALGSMRRVEDIVSDYVCSVVQRRMVSWVSIGSKAGRESMCRRYTRLEDALAYVMSLFLVPGTRAGVLSNQTRDHDHTVLYSRSSSLGARWTSIAYIL
jgi:hypothetical protein